MKNQVMIPLIAAGACGLVAVLGIQQYLAGKNVAEQVETTKVLVAVSPIRQGVALDELNTKFITVAVGVAPEGVVTDMAQVDLRSLKVARSAGDWIMADQLTEQGQMGASAVIPTGMRVATIPVDATTNHSGMLQPGNRIDLLLSYKWKDPETKNQVQKVRPLLEYIEVFAVDNSVYGVSSDGDTAKARNISLLVDTEQMLLLRIAQDKGKLSTVLRSNEDKEEISVADMSEDILNGAINSSLNETSTVGAFDHLAEPEPPAFALPEEKPEPEPVMMAQLMLEVEENTEPEFWTMTIHEGGSRRRERVNLDSEDPLFEPSMGPPSSGPTGPPGRGRIPGPPGVSTPELPELAEGLNVDFEEGGFEEAASDLLELLN